MTFPQQVGSVRLENLPGSIRANKTGKGNIADAPTDHAQDMLKSLRDSLRSSLKEMTNGSLRQQTEGVFPDIFNPPTPAVATPASSSAKGFQPPIVNVTPPRRTISDAALEKAKSEALALSKSISGFQKTFKDVYFPVAKRVIENLFTGGSGPVIKSLTLLKKNPHMAKPYALSKVGEKIVKGLYQGLGFIAVASTVLGFIFPPLFLVAASAAVLRMIMSASITYMASKNLQAMSKFSMSDTSKGQAQRAQNHLIKSGCVAVISDAFYIIPGAGAAMGAVGIAAPWILQAAASLWSGVTTAIPAGLGLLGQTIADSKAFYKQIKLTTAKP
jgi:hypothetical protein